MKRFECRGILFDLDGVLVDSTAYVEEQWRRWANAKGLVPEPFLRVCHGRRAVETIRLAASLAGVHLGRIERNARGPHLLELLVLDY
jgi:beta-phosphoglucomutase-like phosphatase (HAD superfamily)